MDRQREGGEKGVDLKWIRPRSHKAIRFTHSVKRHGQHSVAYLNFTWGTKVQNAAHLICLYHFHLWRCVSCVDDSLTSLFTFSLNKIRIKDQVSSLSFVKAFFKAFYEAPYVKTRFLPVVSWYQNIISHQVSRHLTNISPVYYVSCIFICTCSAVWLVASLKWFCILQYFVSFVCFSLFRPLCSKSRVDG